MEEEDVTHKWFHIAKAEFLVQTAGIRRRRRFALFGFLLLSIVWAVYLAPTVMSALISGLGPEIQLFLMAALPGFMRSAVFLVWTVILVMPLSQSLQEIKVSQWEVMLSHKVSTRDIMIGTFIARIPVYGLILMFLAPLLVAPFVIIYKVSLVGQLIMYLALFFVALGTLWLSNFVTTAIQAKLGESPRGNDLAKALTYALAILLVVPMYGLMFFAPQLSQIMGTNIFLFFPFTWGGDLITWTIVSFNGIGLSGSIVALFESILGLTAIFDLLFLSIFTLGIVGVALFSADRLFRIVAGVRTEKVVTVGKDGVFLRGLKRIAPGAFGILLVTAVKDFTRKVQNTSGLLYGVILTVLVPVMVGSVDPSMDLEMRFFMASLEVGLVMGMMSGMTFGGIGFMDSQDQLWIIKSAPNGAAKFVKARVVEGFLLALVFSLIPPIVLTVAMGFGVVEMLGLFGITYLSVCGGMLIGTGITANNPSYDDTKSKAFTANRMMTVAIYMITFMGWMIAMLALRLFEKTGFMVVFLTVPALLEGLIAVYIGGKRLGRQL